MPGKTKTTKSATSTLDGMFDEEPPNDNALIEEAPKALRHILEEELRALPLADRIARVIGLCGNDRGEADLKITAVRVASGEIRYRASIDEHDSMEDGGKFAPIDEAVVQLGAHILAKLEHQADELREVTSKIDGLIATVRGPR